MSLLFAYLWRVVSLLLMIGLAWKLDRAYSTVFDRRELPTKFNVTVTYCMYSVSTVDSRFTVPFFPAFLHALCVYGTIVNTIHDSRLGDW